MCFFRNGSLYNFETCTIVISMPGNLSMHLVWPSKYKGKWCFIPKCVFSEMDHHTTLKPVPLWSACLKTSGYTWVWPSKYKGKWCFIPKCVFSEMDQHTALTFVAMQLACLRTSGCAEFGPLNTKENDVLFQNVFSQKQIIIQLWNLDHCNWHTWKPQGLLSLALQIHRKVMFYSKMCFLRNGSLYNFDTCTMVIGMPGNLSVHLVWPSKYKGKWCFIPKCVFSEMDHCITLRLLPLWLACLETSVCT